MRNLKKILAMVLALVMSLSLMATAGAAQFPDVDDSNPYKTAIDVLDELKVFQGFEDGTFKPTDTLNRAQAAVLVYRIATGDVENKYLDNYTYMQQSKFNDLDGYNWAKGYINYCQNAGIVVGTSATTFNPGAPVTGYQLMVMLLRTLGYGKAGEFTDPKGWELETAKIAEREGMLKNVTGGDFGAPAPRQMVAEILFRGLLHDTVEYSPLTPGGYTNSGETLGKRELGLEDIKGVVMANEFADLEDDDTLADGKTRLDVDGKVYNLDIKSELTDIGEIRHAYVQNGTKVLTTLENLNDSTVNQPENGKGTKVSDLSKVNSDTQYFLNFEPLESNTSEWRIEFNVEFVDNNAVNPPVTKEEAKDAFEAAYGDVDYLKSVGGSEYKFTKSIKAGNEITPADLQIIKGIFNWADGSDNNDSDAEAEINDGIKGSVYVGANSQSSTNRNKNLAVEMTFNKFKAEYIDGTYTTISSSDNGEWLKTIDNNGDGVADYVFRTDFVMSVIEDYNTKTETYHVEFDAASGGKDRKANDTIKKSAVVTEDELKVGDVVLYTWIDGKCYVSHPEVDTTAIDKKGIDYKNKTITCGDTTYDWSGIEQEAYHYYHDVSEANVQVNYNLYKDHFGYVRLFAEATKGFVLLTDGFYATDLKHADQEVYKAEIWDEADEKLAEIDVAAPGGFINNVIDNNSGKLEEGVWARLNGFDVVYDDHVDDGAAHDVTPWDYVTNIAAYDKNADGAYSLSKVENLTNRYYYGAHELDMASFKDGDIKDKDLDVSDNHSGDNRTGVEALERVNATDETLYYYVEWATDSYGVDRVSKVTTWTGYKNAKASLADNDRAYAVTLSYRNADNTAWLRYETAEIIVIEHEIVGEDGMVLPVTLTQRMIGSQNKVGGTGFTWDSESGKWILADFEGRYANQGRTPVVTSVDLNNNGQQMAPIDISDLLHFYKIDGADENKLKLIDEDYSDHNIYAGKIVTLPGTEGRSYGQIRALDGSADFSTMPTHDFYSTDPMWTIGYDRDAALEQDQMLWNRYQRETVYGDVASTFSADELERAEWEIGDEVIYVTTGKGVVQSIINVTQSAIKVEGVWTYPGVYGTDFKTGFDGDPHTKTQSGTISRYTTTWTLESLYEDIIKDQGETLTDAWSITYKFVDADGNDVDATGITVTPESILKSKADKPAEVKITTEGYDVNKVEVTSTNSDGDKTAESYMEPDGKWYLNKVTDNTEVTVTLTAKVATYTVTLKSTGVSPAIVKPVPVPADGGKTVVVNTGDYAVDGYEITNVSDGGGKVTVATNPASPSAGSGATKVMLNNPTEDCEVTLTYTPIDVSFAADLTAVGGGNALTKTNVAWSITKADGTAGATGNMGTAPTNAQLAWGDTITLTWTGAEFENYTVSNVTNSTFAAGELEYKADDADGYSIRGVVKGAVNLTIDAGVVPAVTVNTALDTGALGATIKAEDGTTDLEAKYPVGSGALKFKVNAASDTRITGVSYQIAGSAPVELELTDDNIYELRESAFAAEGNLRFIVTAVGTVGADVKLKTSAANNPSGDTFYQVKKYGDTEWSVQKKMNDTGEDVELAAGDQVRFVSDVEIEVAAATTTLEESGGDLKGGYEVIVTIATPGASGSITVSNKT